MNVEIIRCPSGFIEELATISSNQFLKITEPYSCRANYCTGANNNSWEIAGNWSCVAVPGITSNVIIPAGSVVVINANNTINSLKLKSPKASL